MVKFADASIEVGKLALKAQKFTTQTQTTDIEDASHVLKSELNELVFQRDIRIV